MEIGPTYLRMSPDFKFDQLLAPIAQPLRAQADTLLDLRDAATEHPHPGRCISCYFRLLENASDQATPKLTPLRRWLEEHVEIVAVDGKQQNRELEVFPLDLNGADNLEACCQGTIRTVLHDRAFTDTHQIAMQFRFRDSVAAA